MHLFKIKLKSLQNTSLIWGFPLHVEEKCINIDMVNICVVEGDITEMNVDAIVNPANSLMIMGGGVAAAIKKKGGANIEVEARRKAPVPVGEAIVTSAGKLRAKYVIHAPTMPKPAMRTTLDAVYRATRAALKVADRLGISTIAFPGMGTGVGGLDYYDSAKMMLNAIKDHISSTITTIKRIYLVAWGSEAYIKFTRALEDFKYA